MTRRLNVGWFAVFAFALFGLRAMEGQDAASVPAIATNHTLKGTYINSGLDTNTGGVVSPAEYFPIDSQLTVACPGTSGTCSIEADMWVQNGNETFTSNTYGMCFFVDGTPAPNCASTVGSTPSDGTYVQGSTSEIVSGVAHGSRTVQTKSFSGDGAHVGYYTIIYRVYRP
jgi:hypothetical protein